MAIYILENYPHECVKYLDDLSLYEMTKDIADVLYITCNEKNNNKIGKKIPSNLSSYLDNFVDWCKSYIYNYIYFVNLGIACVDEFHFRFRNAKFNKYQKSLIWYRYNIPNLLLSSPGWLSKETGSKPKIVFNGHTEFPILVPKKYLVKSFGSIDPIETYRNYYCNNLTKKLKNTCYNEDAIIGSKIIKSRPVWTNRKKPQWIHLEY